MPRAKKEKAPKPPTFFKERKAFVTRLIKNVSNWSCEMKFTKVLFNKYPVDFLNVVKPPFEMKSLAYFISGDGEKYLNTKLSEFKFRPQEEKIQVFEGKIGEDSLIIKKRSIRQFLQ